MSPPEPTPPVIDAYREGLLAAGEAATSLAVVETGLPPGLASSSFAARFPARYATRPSSEFVAAVEERCRGGAVVFAGAPAAWLSEEGFPSLVRTLFLPRLPAKLVAFAGAGPRPGAVRDDLATMRSLPAVTVVAPADGPTTRAATVALAEREGPAYLRLPPATSATVGDGTFAVGRARELRAGSDLTIVSLGRMLGRSIEVADELARVGVSVRVLDVASVKPFDEAAVLRAARDTGAILVVEDAPVGGGVGTLVAAMTAENHPVPVRRVGLPDVWPGADDRPDDPGVSLDRVRDEAWELLRLRGRIT
jgi:transketolase